jgi:hypothetical protein
MRHEDTGFPLTLSILEIAIYAASGRSIADEFEGVKNRSLKPTVKKTLDLFFFIRNELKSHGIIEESTTESLARVCESHGITMADFDEMVKNKHEHAAMMAATGRGAGGGADGPPDAATGGNGTYC